MSPERSPRTTIATSDVARERDGRGQLVVGPVRDPGAPRVDDLGARPAPTEGVEDGPPPRELVDRLDDLAVADDPERVAAGPHLAQRLHVDQVAVVAEQVAGAVGDRPDDRDALAAGASGSTPSFSTRTIERSASDAGGAATPPRRASSKAASAGTSTYGPVEEPEPELHAQDPLDGRVEQRLVDPAVRERRRERLAERHGSRQLGVDAGGERQPRRLAEVRRQPVGGRDHLDADVVRRDDAVEAPLAAQDPVEQLGRGVARHAVDVAVGRHDAARCPRRRTAASNGKSCSSRSSRGPTWAGAWLSPPSASPWPTMCLPVAITPSRQVGPWSAAT